jgi:hypothetical protein
MNADIIAELNAGYRCPADAGPAWREAVRMGMDMSLIDCNLEMSPWDRLLQNDSVLAFVHQLQRSNPLCHAQPDGDP